MSIPFYVCGLAEFGKDEAFHGLDAELQALRIDATTVTGRDAANLMTRLSRQGQLRHPTFPVPFECSIIVLDHQKSCGSVCEHDKHCASNASSWYPLKDQKHPRYAGELSDGLAQHLITFFSNDTEELRTTLAATLASHGDAILKRWKKLSKAKRGLLLANISPRMFGPWPVEVTRTRLVSLLHVRTLHSAASWSAFDTRKNHMAWCTSYYPAWFSKRCVTMCGSNYASLSDFDEELCHRWAMMGFPRALMTMQIQHELMYTLRDIVDALIGGQDSSGMEAWTNLVSGGLHPAGRDKAWNPYTCQPYTHPPSFSPKQMAGTAQNRLNMITDELSLMQTDPAYMQQLIKAKRVAIGNITTDIQRKHQLSHAGPLLMIEHINRYLIWQLVSSQCHGLAEVFEQFGPRCDPGLLIPSDASHRMSDFSRVLDTCFRSASKNFEGILHSTRAMQHKFQGHQVAGQLYINENEGALDPDNPADRLLRRIRTFHKTADGPIPADGLSAKFVDLFADEQCVQVMDKPTEDHVSDLVILDDMRTLMTWCQRGCCWDQEPPGETTGNHSCVHEDPDTRPPELVFEYQWQQRIDILIRSFMDAPWPNGRKDLAWLAKADETRKRLAALWCGIAEAHEKAEKAGGQHSLAGQRLISAITSSNTDANYLAALDQERSLCAEESRRMNAIAEVNAMKLLNYAPQSEWGVN
ncbi:uncharacterized protein RCC_00715 [Ramularia collo-cygni]|uniref:Uncharacterized protein n=1 Tax=Ramularia collo-cygni TaxID=112498 RepID=A0A2D3UPG2_9PEZI|nr:uncharacterized protein RCC_00715 [Ramularia collo-cygni]CZT14755.1 uncharacterized protein RCC_00715 [Ramularia collo-cygni]